MSSTRSFQAGEDTSTLPQVHPWKNPLFRPFWSLRHRKYAIYWTALTAQAWVMNIQMFVRSWYAYDLKDQAWLIGVVAVAQGIPVIFLSLFGGTLADRLNNRTVLIAGFTVATFSTLATAIVIAIGAIQWWHLIPSALGTGVGMSLASGARFSIISELVDRTELLNAVSLSNLAQNLARVAAPALAGVMLATTFGITGVYFLMAGLSVSSVIIVMFLPSGPGRTQRKKQSMIHDMTEGLAYVKHHEVILWLVLMYMVTASFGMPFVFLLPVLAKAAWTSTPTQIGLLFSLLGVGSLIGSLGTASLGEFQKKGLLLLVVSTGFGAGIIALSLSPVYLIALLVMVPLGMFQASRLSLNAALVQLQAPDQIRGRIMGVYDFGNGVFPIGVLLISVLSDVLNPQYALTISGAVVVLFCCSVLISRPSLRTLR